MYIHWMQVDYSQTKLTLAEVDSDIWSLLASFYQGGQCEPEQLLLKKTNKQLTYQLRTPEKNSLSKKYFNKYTKNAVTRLKEQHITYKFELIAKQPLTEGICSCKECAGYILTGDDNSTHIVKCIDCKKNIPLYKFSTLDDGYYYDFVMWNSNHDACYDLQLGCTVLEYEALRELYSLHSNLTKAGLACRDRLAKLTGKPVYYNLYRYYAASEDMDRARKCPSCGGEWLLENIWLDKYDYRCDKCHLLSNLAYRFDY